MSGRQETVWVDFFFPHGCYGNRGGRGGRRGEERMQGKERRDELRKGKKDGRKLNVIVHETKKKMMDKTFVLK